ncbi:MAG: phage tail tape measure protein [Psychrobacter sp.]
MASVLSRIQVIMEANTANYNNELRKARKNSKSAFSDISTNAAKMALGVGVALAGMGALSIKTAMSFETSMAEIDKTVEFTSNNGLANMRKELQALSTQIPQTFEELAAVTATGGQLGIAEKDLVHFTEVMAKMGVAFDIPAQQAADSMAKIANVFQIPIANIDRLGDAINTLSNNTPATAEQLIDSLQRVGGIAKVYGLSADATVGLTGALIAMGKPAEVASTAVNSLLGTFSSLDNATKSQIIGFEQLGLNIDDFSQLVKTDGKKAITTYLDAINQLEQSKRIGTNNLIIGKEFGDDITMLAGSVSVLDNNWAMLGETVNTTKDYFGSMDVEFKKISATTANKMVLLKNNIDGVAASVGDAFIPALNELLLNMTPMVATIGTWASANPELIQQITLVGGSLLGAIVSLKLFADGVAAAKTAIDGLKLAHMALASPMGLTVIALGILVTAGLLVYQNWDKIKAVIDANKPAFIALSIAVAALTVALIAANAPLIVLSTLSAIAMVQTGVMTVATAAWSVAAGIAAAATWTFNAALAVLTSPITLVVVAITALVAVGVYLYRNWDEIKAKATEIWGSITSYIGGKIDAIKGYFSSSFPAMTAIVGGALKAMWSVVSAQFNLIKTVISTALNVVKAIFKGDFAAIPGIIGNGLKAAAGIVGNMMGNILNVIKNTGAKLYQIGKDIINGLINGIKDRASAAVNAVKDTASGMYQGVKNFFVVRSPSRLMRELGVNIVDGLIIGIKDKKSEAYKAAVSVANSVLEGIESTRKSIALFGNDSAVAAFDYDVLIGKYDDIAPILREKYRADLIKLENMKAEEEKRARITSALKSRAAQFQTDQTSAADAFGGLEVNGPQTEAGKLQLAYQNKMAIVDRFEQMHTDKTAQAEAARLALTENYNQSIKDLEMQRQAANIGSITALFGMALGETSKGYKAMFLVQKAYDFVSAQSASFTAIAKAWSSAPFPANLPAVGITTLQTGIIPAAIQALNPKGFMKGGYTGNYPTDMPIGPVHGKEFVTHAEATRKYRPELEAMNDGTYDRGNNKAGPAVNIYNYTGAPVTQRQNSNGELEIMIGEELNKQLPAIVSDPSSKFNKSLQDQYHLQRSL